MPDKSSPHLLILFLSDAGNNIGLSTSSLPTDLLLQVFLKPLFANKLIYQNNRKTFLKSQIFVN